MEFPILRAEGIIVNKDKTEILVQCDVDESFYRLPGGTVEFGETAVETIKRELMEEYDLAVDIEELACINENVVQFNGKPSHNCTLIHWCSSNIIITNGLIHNENPNVKLVWRTISQLRERPSYPDGILDVLTSNNTNISHIKIVKSYN